MIGQVLLQSRATYKYLRYDFSMWFRYSSANQYCTNKQVITANEMARSSVQSVSWIAKTVCCTELLECTRKAVAAKIILHVSPPAYQVWQNKE